MTPRANLIIESIEDAVADLLYYDRKEDEDLPRDAIEEAVAAGEITVDQMVAAFRDSLAAALA